MNTMDNGNEQAKFSSASDELFNSSDHTLVDLGGVLGNSDNSGVSLKSRDISDALLGEEVKATSLERENTLEYPNYTLDFSGVTEIAQYQMEGLASLLDDNGDVAIYIAAGKSVSRLGSGRSNILNRLLAIVIKNIFNGSCKVYHNIDANTKPIEVQGFDSSVLRMQI